MICTCVDPASRSCPACREHEEAKRRERYSDRIARSGLPANLRGLSLLGVEGGPARQAAEQWIGGDLRGLCLTGAAGVGKTWLAAASAWARLREHPVRWVPVARLMTQLRAGFNSEMKRSADQVLAGSSAIVLDDLDKANPSQFGREVVFAAIDAREQAGASLLVTTNLKPSELEARYGEAIASRVAGYCTTVQMVGRDRRLG